VRVLELELAETEKTQQPQVMPQVVLVEVFSTLKPMALAELLV
jgi:hypothetical protein